MPVIFVTVEEALGDLAKLKRGERVLIHAAAGGVGLVAIQCLSSKLEASCHSHGCDHSRHCS